MQAGAVPVTFGFDGAGWMGAFHFGVAMYLEQYISRCCPQLRFTGVSAGACVAAGLAMNIDIHALCQLALSRQLEAKNDPFSMCECVPWVFERATPDEQSNFLTGVNGRFACNLSIAKLGGVSVVYTPLVYTEFHSRSELISVLRGTTHIPVLGGALGSVVGDARVFDGCLSADFISYPENDARTLMVHISPWGRSKPGWIAADVRFPEVWSFVSRSLKILRIVTELGRLRAAQYFAKLRKAGHVGAFQHICQHDNLGTEDLLAVETALEQLLEKFKSEHEVYGEAEYYSPCGAASRGGYTTTATTVCDWEISLAASLARNGQPLPSIQVLRGSDNKVESELQGTSETKLSAASNSYKLEQAFEESIRQVLGLSTTQQPGWDTNVKALFN
mmetsp:Transcript_21738/g.73878  ORF Transcript_21738/g.73878 Transcript_21738/m.73878 type:complete len:390 (+) Transcript_21738:449-1618(+)|eukprot:CAMPEP_0183795194 /NCGR_PEP_ID=MMETSP0803_2-20130417/4277_1 /TAXON_ID=195967 /ORGANISM="Crustomastix stigmata, Strain CCMP3273" /LENGTH=389 /DNA_ID=CAMNT_0026039605 /DNA_START=405 /DNA_END=1574 /DNA_ORIENTATION=+